MQWIDNKWLVSGRTLRVRPRRYTNISIGLPVPHEPNPILKAKQDKPFFSEEKKQKTFDFSGVCAACIVRDSIKQKSFGSFLQKRTLFWGHPWLCNGLIINGLFPDGHSEKNYFLTSIASP